MGNTLRARAFGRYALGVGFTLCALLHGRSVQAEQQEAPPNHAPSWTGSVQRAVAAGSYLPLSLTPELSDSSAQASVQPGYDGARDEATLRSFAQAKVYGPLALRLGVASGSASRLAPSVGARVQLLDQRSYGISLAASVFYKAEGFTELEGEIENMLSVARRFDAWLVVLSAAYGQDPEGHERDAELTLGCLLQLSPMAHLGVDARGRLGVGPRRETARAQLEPLSDFQAGPLLSLALGPLAVTAQAGVSALRNADQATRTGLVVAAGVGSAF